MSTGTGQRIQYSLITGAVLICLALLVSWWLNNFELVEEEYRTGVSLEARRNPFLAAELFLREMGTDVESVNGRARLQQLPPVTDIILVNEFDGNLSPDRYEKLLDWIDAGGQLFIAAENLWNEERKSSGNRLLDEFGIHLTIARDINDGGLIQSITDIAQVDFDGGGSARVAFNKYYYLEDVKKLASDSISGKSGVHLLQIPYGDGLITVMSDNNFLKNPDFMAIPGLNFSSTSIADNDHAYFLWHLTGKDRKVWLVYDTHSPSITSLLWEKAPQASIAFIILVLFWLWSMRNSFGPRLPAFEQPRRNLLEHILMTTSFEWQQDRAHNRVLHNRALLQQEIRSRHPNISSMEPADKCNGLSKISGIAADKIYFALYADWKTEREFIQLSNLIKSLRQKL